MKAEKCAVYLGVLVAVCCVQASALPLSPTASKKCPKAAFVGFLKWKLMSNPCQYLCEGRPLRFEYEDNGTPCQKFVFPGECLNGKCLRLLPTLPPTESPTTTQLPTTATEPPPGSGEVKENPVAQNIPDDSSPEDAATPEDVIASTTASVAQGGGDALPKATLQNEESEAGDETVTTGTSKPSAGTLNAEAEGTPAGEGAEESAKGNEDSSSAPTGETSVNAPGAQGVDNSAKDSKDCQCPTDSEGSQNAPIKENNVAVDTPSEKDSKVAISEGDSKAEANPPPVSHDVGQETSTDTKDTESLPAGDASQKVDEKNKDAPVGTSEKDSISGDSNVASKPEGEPAPASTQLEDESQKETVPNEKSPTGEASNSSPLKEEDPAAKTPIAQGVKSDAPEDAGNTKPEAVAAASKSEGEPATASTQVEGEPQKEAVPNEETQAGEASNSPPLKEEDVKSGAPEDAGNTKPEAVAAAPVTGVASESPKVTEESEGSDKKDTGENVPKNENIGTHEVASEPDSKPHASEGGSQGPSESASASADVDRVASGETNDGVSLAPEESSKSPSEKKDDNAATADTTSKAKDEGSVDDTKPEGDASAIPEDEDVSEPKTTKEAADSVPDKEREGKEEVAPGSVQAEPQNGAQDAVADKDAASDPKIADTDDLQHDAPAGPQVASADASVPVQDVEKSQPKPSATNDSGIEVSEKETQDENAKAGDATNVLPEKAEVPAEAESTTSEVLDGNERSESSVKVEDGTGQSDAAEDGAKEQEPTDAQHTENGSSATKDESEGGAGAAAGTTDSLVGEEAKSPAEAQEPPEQSLGDAQAETKDSTEPSAPQQIPAQEGEKVAVTETTKEVTDRSDSKAEEADKDDSSQDNDVQSSGAKPSEQATDVKDDSASPQPGNSSDKEDKTDLGTSASSVDNADKTASGEGAELKTGKAGAPDSSDATAAESKPNEKVNAQKSSQDGSSVTDVVQGQTEEALTEENAGAGDAEGTKERSEIVEAQQVATEKKDNDEGVATEKNVVTLKGDAIPGSTDVPADTDAEQPTEQEPFEPSAAVVKVTAQ